MLGSALSGTNVIPTRDCDGRAPSGNSRSCTITQGALPGRQLTVPSDGLIRAFTVRGTTGPVALQVLRIRDGRTFQVSRSDTVDVPDTGAHRYDVELDAGAGDRIALAVDPRTGVGLRATAGARTERWIGQVSEGSGAGERGGLDRELMLRAELDPGAVRDAHRRSLAAPPRACRQGARSRRRARACPMAGRCASRSSWCRAASRSTCSAAACAGLD